jgi:hypothetical protein
MENANTIWSIIRRVRNGNEINMEEAEHLANITDRSRRDCDIIELLETRTGQDWLQCEDSGLFFPEYQAAPVVGSLSGEPYFELVLAASHRYVWATDQYGDEGYTRRDEAYLTCNDGYITDENYNRNYFTCGACGDVFHNDDYHSEGECESCAEARPAEVEDDPIYAYSTRIENVLSMRLEPRVRYFGLEIEQEFDSGEREEEALWAMEHIDGLVDMSIWKADGSLNNGAELVTLPKTLSYWQGDNPVKALCTSKHWRAAARSHNTTTCGLHIHVSRGTIPEPVIAKLVVLFNDPSMGETTALVARRAPSVSWCAAKKKRWHSDLNPYWKASMESYENGNSGKPQAYAHRRPACNINKRQEPQGDRYTPVNLTPSTVEFRIFRGTLKWETVLASIEFCDAAIAFCTQYGAASMHGKAFRKFLQDHVTRKTYPALRDYLQLRTLLPKPRPKTDRRTVEVSAVSEVEETPSATFMLDPYDGGREVWYFSQHRMIFNIAEGHFIAYSDMPVPVQLSDDDDDDEITHVQPGEIWWNSTSIASLRVQATNFQI